MSTLFTCSDCGGTVSRRAEACPHCGAPAANASDSMDIHIRLEGEGTGQLRPRLAGMRMTRPAAVLLYWVGLIGFLLCLPALWLEGAVEWYLLTGVCLWSVVAARRRMRWGQVRFELQSRPVDPSEAQRADAKNAFRGGPF